MSGYKILAFGRHSDLLNLGISIRDEIQKHAPCDSVLYSDRDFVDGQLVSDLDVLSVRPLDLLRRIHVDGRDQLIHVVAPNFWSLLCALVGRVRGCTVLYHCHRLDFLSFHPLKALQVFVYTLLIFFISDKVFVHSDKIKKFLIWTRKIIYVELPKYKFSSASFDAHIPGTEVLFFGRLDSNKGVDLLAQIVELLPDVRFRICGELVDPSLKKTLEFLSEKTNVLVQEGRMEQRFLPTLFQSAKCAILPYSGATQSGIPYLARSLMTPVLVADVGDLATTVSNPVYGKCISTRDPAVWAQVIKETDWHNLRCGISKLDEDINSESGYLIVIKQWLEDTNK